MKQRYWITIILSLTGVLAGYLYWRFIGCQSGSCPITSNWHMSVLMGGLMGYFTGDSIADFNEKRRSKNERDVE